MILGLALATTLWASASAEIPNFSSTQTAKAPSPGQTFLKNSTLSWFLSLNGPALSGRRFEESYNPFVGDRWPIQFFSSLAYEYRFNSRFAIEGKLSGVFNAASGVVTRQGTTVEKSAQFLHPTVNFNWSRVIDQPWLDLWVGVGVMIPTSDFARNKQTQIFSLPIDQTWTFKKMPKPWSIGINTRVQPTFYEKWTPRSPTELRRQVFLFSFGHFLNYRINDSFELCSSTVFDFDRYAGDTETFLRNAVDDRWRLEFFWYPQNSALHNLGLFLQGKFWNPLPENTTVGTQLTIRL